mmetsp:Transcript_59405/g.145903  ORF Transcript_59405/g.145903 Transcript_59405/m.145903 type:complete len:180 (+) Transcript_59405:1903-2442(+)
MCTTYCRKGCRFLPEDSTGRDAKKGAGGLLFPHLCKLKPLSSLHPWLQGFYAKGVWRLECAFMPRPPVVPEQGSKRAKGLVASVLKGRRPPPPCCSQAPAPKRAPIQKATGSILKGAPLSLPPTSNKGGGCCPACPQKFCRAEPSPKRAVQVSLSMSGRQTASHNYRSLGSKGGGPGGG